MKEEVETALSRLSENIASRRRGTAIITGLGPFGRTRLHARYDGHGAEFGDERRHRCGMAKRKTDARFVWDSYRRFQQMYGDVVMGVSHDYFEEIIDDYKFENALSLDADLTPMIGAIFACALPTMIEEEVGRAVSSRSI